MTRPRAENPHSRSLLFPGDRVSVVGHRGLGRGVVVESGERFPENTLASHLRARELGVDAVEVDVVRTRDGGLVLSHDTFHLGRGPIDQMSLEEAEEAGHAPLEDLFEVLDPLCGVVVELKSVLSDLEAERPSAELVVEVLARERAQRPERPLVCYGFDPSLSEVLTELAGQRSLELPLGLIAVGGTSLSLLTLAAAELGIGLVSGFTTTFLGALAERQQLPHTLPEVLAVGHRAGLAYMCWTPDLGECRELIAAGIDAVCIDEVPSMLGPIREMSAARSRGEALGSLPLPQPRPRLENIVESTLYY